jgi:hypothetical protein
MKKPVYYKFSAMIDSHTAMHPKRAYKDQSLETKNLQGVLLS